MYAFIDYTWIFFIINVLIMLANDPFSSIMEQVGYMSKCKRDGSGWGAM